MKVGGMTIGQSGERLDRRREGRGFVAAIDQSGGSTPRMLAAYRIEAGAYANDPEMFELVHRMRERIIRSPRFDAAKVLATILFPGHSRSDHRRQGDGEVRVPGEGHRPVPQGGQGP
jgi:fructose-bisphosphate aldolase class 1